MENKCTKYEDLFIFADEKTLEAHVKSCSECQKEQEKMNKISELLCEVKPEYLRRKAQKKTLRAACMIFVLFLCGISFNTLDSKYSIVDNIKYGQVVSMEDMGFPVDSYGLIMVE